MPTFQMHQMEEVDFYQALVEVAIQNEGERGNPYVDRAADNNITIGIGMNISTNRGALRAVLLAMGDTYVQYEENIWNNVLHQSDGSVRRYDNNSDIRNALNRAVNGIFSLSQNQMREAYITLARTNMQVIRQRCGLDTNEYQDVYYREMISLYSLYHNLPNLIGPLLRNAFINIEDPFEARAEAWYQIRYNHRIYSDGHGQNQHHRYVDSEIFGLYQNNDQAEDIQEALGIYRWYTKRINGEFFRLNNSFQIITDNNNQPIISETVDLISFDNQEDNEQDRYTANDRLVTIANAGINVSTADQNTNPNPVRTIYEEFTSAANLVKLWIVNHIIENANRLSTTEIDNLRNLLASMIENITSMNIRVAKDSGSKIDAREKFIRPTNVEMLEHIDETTTPMLLIGAIGNDTLRGGNGDDIIVGQGGNDILFACGGDDISLRLRLPHDKEP